jgi:opacity protein-like surface antigen
MKKISLLFILLFVLGSFASASAIDQTGKFAIGGYAGYAFGFGDAFKDYDFGYYSYKNKLTFCLGAKVKYGFKPNLALVGALDYQAGDVDVELKVPGFAYGASESYDWTAILGNVLYSFSPEKKTIPNLTGGVGLYMDGDTEMGINLGGGVEHFFQDNLALDAGARFHMIFTEGESTTYLQFLVGVMYYFGVK